MSASSQVPAPADPASRRAIHALLHPQRIGLIGVSAKGLNFGRIILRNLVARGYPPEQLVVVRPATQSIDGVTCVPDLASLEAPLDLFIVALNAEAVFPLVDELLERQCARAVMLVPGGLGETAASREPAARMQARIVAARQDNPDAPRFLGGNCLGVVSHPGGYDSWFIPEERLPKPAKRTPRDSALISQSGAFMITRLSQNPWLDPAYMVALGNQLDLSHGEMLDYFVDHEDIRCIGVYVEGFREGDEQTFIQAARRARSIGKQVVVYKAGRNPTGVQAVAAHTASRAGDYAQTRAALEAAGVLVAATLEAFDDLFYLAGCLASKRLGGRRIGILSGAGFETVAMADNLGELEAARLSPATLEALGELLKAKRLDSLATPGNPLDINPGADDEAHVEGARLMLQDSQVDAVVLGLDPLSPRMRTLEACSQPGFDLDSPKSLVQTLPRLAAAADKPLIGVVDGGNLYHPLVERLRDAGICVFSTSDRALRALDSYFRVQAQTEAAARD